MERRKFLKGSIALAALSQMPTFALAAPRVQTKNKAEPSDTVPPEVFIYNRIAFGYRPRDLEQFHWFPGSPKKRIEGLIETQLHPESIADADCENRLKNQHFKTLHKSVKELWKDHFIAANEVRDMVKAGDFKGGDTRPLDSMKAAKRDENDVRKMPAREIERATWIRAVYSERQLEQVLTDFWHNHFNVFGWDNQIAPVFVQYDRDVIRPNVLGNFRRMLEAVAASPAMLFYLDNFINQSGNPNENYARELFELHTLGAENYLGTRDRTEVPGFHQGNPIGYVDGDVYEAARCFTGWRTATGKNTSDSGEFEYYDPWHDRFQKIVLGHPLKEYQSPMQDGRQVLDLLAKHEGTSRFIAKKLCVRFVSDSPPPELIKRVARTFHEARDAKDQLRQTMRTILHSPEFLSNGAPKIKRPFEFIVSALRATQADFDPTEEFIKKSSSVGQRLFDWHSPDGYPDTHEKWTGASTLVNRWRFCNQLAHGNIDGISTDLPRPKPQELGSWLERFYGRKPSVTTLQAIHGFFAQGQINPKQQSQEALSLALMAPEFQWR